MILQNRIIHYYICDITYGQYIIYKMLDELRELAFKFQIDPEKTVGHAASMTSVISVLTNINESFQNFLEVEFFKNKEFVKAFNKNEKVLEILKEDLELLLVDLKFGSFEASAVPNITSKPFMFNDTLQNWKKNTFIDYKENILNGDFEDSTFLKNVINKYSENERSQIFKPLFSTISQNYKLNLIGSNSKKVFRQPSKEFYDFYVPKTTKIKEPKSSDYKTVQFYARIRKNEDGFNLSKKNIKQVYYFEELEHETYPFKPNSIVFETTAYTLYKRLDCKVDFEDDLYVIQNTDFDITVWGQSREEVEYSFAFTFHSLYQNFGIENDSKLSEESKQLKQNLLKTVKKVIYESQKS